MKVRPMLDTTLTPSERERKHQLSLIVQLGIAGRIGQFGLVNPADAARILANMGYLDAKKDRPTDRPKGGAR